MQFQKPHQQKKIFGLAAILDFFEKWISSLSIGAI